MRRIISFVSTIRKNDNENDHHILRSETYVKKGMESVIPRVPYMCIRKYVCFIKIYLPYYSSSCCSKYPKQIMKAKHKDG